MRRTTTLNQIDTGKRKPPSRAKIESQEDRAVREAREDFNGYYVGIDVGITTHSPCAVAVYEHKTDRVIFTCVVSPSEKHGNDDNVDDRIIEIANGIDAVLADLILTTGFDVRAVAYELPHVGINVQTTIKLAKMCGAVVLTAARRGVRAIGVQPAEAKLVLAGAGNANKEQMIEWAYRIYDIKVGGHEADAVGIALAGAHKFWGGVIS